MVLRFLLLMLLWNDNYGGLATQGCGLLLNNTLKSPGYPIKYPKNIHCVYDVPIPDGMAMNVNFEFFEVEYHPSCGYDYLSISNDDAFHKYCGNKTGQAVKINGDYANITFYSDSSVTGRGFLLSFTFVGCLSPLRNWILISPGYPNRYPKNMHCVYKVPIPYGMAMFFYFSFFEVQDGSSCQYDYLTISSNREFHKYCGDKTGQWVVIAGDAAVITFHSDSTVQKSGFVVPFLQKALPVYPPNIASPAAIVRTLPGYRVKFQVNGTTPIYIAIIRNSTVLANTTNTGIVSFSEEGNYTCEAISQYGTDVKNFSVILNDCGPQCSYSWLTGSGNTISCTRVASALEFMNCLTMDTHTINLSSSAITFLPDRVFANQTNLLELRNLSSNATSFLTGRVFNANLESLGKLDLSLNAITFLPDRVFENLTKLFVLNLSSNAITFLPDRVFANLKELMSLNLSSNAITFLPDRVFVNLKELRRLRLSYNAITFLPDRVFANLAKLLALNLTSNAIAFLPDGVFANLTQLRMLDLSTNAITSLPDRVFANLKKLELLKLSSNAITFLPDGVFANLTKLKYLYLSSNAITSLPDRVFASLENLEWLDLSSNDITFLPDRVFANLTNLKNLHLSSNNITSLPDRVFASLENLINLYLSSNAITFLPDRVFANLTDLVMLMLDSNNITFLPDRVFANLTNLILVYLPSNAITFLPDRVFANLTNLWMMSLASNAITFLPDEVFADLTKLNTLILSSNDITFLPDGVFASLTRLENL
ncbi:hypothetical protein ACROYT_G040388 [Oculina patagonica]